MVVIEIYGASDDLVEIEGVFFGDLDEIPTTNVNLLVGGMLKVGMLYNRVGMWEASLSLVDEDLDLPAGFEVSIGFRGHTTVVYITSLDKLTVVEVK